MYRRNKRRGCIPYISTCTGAYVLLYWYTGMYNTPGLSPYFLSGHPASDRAASSHSCDL